LTRPPGLEQPGPVIALSARPLLSDVGLFISLQDQIVDASAFVFSGVKEPNPTGALIGITKDEPLAVRILPNGQALITILLPDEEKGRLPDGLIVSPDILAKLSLLPIGLGDEQTLAASYSPYLTQQVAARRGGFRRAGRMHYAGARGCVAYVKRRLGLSGSMGNGHAVARNLINKRGWRQVSCNNPPVGTVASWTGGVHGLGHTAIWTGWCWKYDIACADPGSRYRLRLCAHR
jgi:hypothetical protein